MSSRAPLPWRTFFDLQSESLRFIDPHGTLRAVASRQDIPPRTQQNAPPADPPSDGLLGKLGAGLGKAVGGMNSMQVNLIRHAWTTSRGMLPVGRTALLTLPDRTSGIVANGSTDGYRRSNRDGQVQFHGRVYTLRQVSRRRTTVIRHDPARGESAIATLRRTGLYWSTHRADQPPRYRLVRRAELDLGDELVVVIAATLCGPPGRPGPISESFSSAI